MTTYINNDHWKTWCLRNLSKLRKQRSWNSRGSGCRHLLECSFRGVVVQPRKHNMTPQSPIFPKAQDRDLPPTLALVGCGNLRLLEQNQQCQTSVFWADVSSVKRGKLRPNHGVFQFRRWPPPSRFCCLSWSANADVHTWKAAAIVADKLPLQPAVTQEPELFFPRKQHNRCQCSRCKCTKKDRHRCIAAP